MKKLLVFLFLISGATFAAETKNTALDPSLKPESPEGVPQVFQDMGVIQGRAMQKSKRFLFSTYGSFDFSDGPYTNYSVNFNPGYAISDFLEIYADLSPLFITKARDIVDRVHQLQLANGNRATITAAQPKYQYGLEVLWAPLYGKDSLGFTRIVRSDTFLKFGAMNVSYGGGTTGMKFVLGVGKTFFLSRMIGLRVAINGAYWQTIIDGSKAFKTMALADGGLVFYF